MSEFVLADRMQGMSGNVIREILKLTQKPDIISLAGGLPSPSAFPVAALQQITTDLFAGDTGFLQYGTTEGLPELVSQVADWVKDVDITARPENVLILTGSQQGIDLACKALLNPGDTVLVEQPTYLAALQLFRMYQAHVVAVPGDAEGMDPTALEQLAQTHNAKMIYVIPTFQNPSGVCWSLARRQSLVEIARRRNMVIIEDDPYGRLRYSGKALPAVAGLDELEHTIYLGSFSKVISPGLRVGYAVGPAQLIRAMVIGKQGTDVHSSNLSQKIVAEFMGRGLLRPHIKQICAQYGAKRDVMLASLAEHFPSQAHWTHPHGGLFIWVELPTDVATSSLMESAVAEKVAFIPGSPFYADGRGDNCMRLNFSNSSLEEIRTAVERLGRVISAAMA